MILYAYWKYIVLYVPISKNKVSYLKISAYEANRVAWTYPCAH